MARKLSYLENLIKEAKQSFKAYQATGEMSQKSGPGTKMLVENLLPLIGPRQALPTIKRFQSASIHCNSTPWEHLMA